MEALQKHSRWDLSTEQEWILGLNKMDLMTSEEETHSHEDQ